MERPAIVSAFGILNILFAAARLPRTLLFIHTFAYARAHDPGLGARMRDHALYAFSYDWYIPISLLTFVLLLLSGIGLLKLKEWARKLAIAYGIFTTTYGVIFTYTRFVYFVAPVVEKGLRSHGLWGDISTSTAIISSISSIVLLGYPIMLVVFLTRPLVAAAFRPAIPPPAIPRA